MPPLRLSLGRLYAKLVTSSQGEIQRRKSDAIPSVLLLLCCRRPNFSFRLQLLRLNSEVLGGSSACAWHCNYSFFFFFFKGKVTVPSVQTKGQSYRWYYCSMLIGPNRWYSCCSLSALPTGVSELLLLASDKQQSKVRSNIGESSGQRRWQAD